LRVPEVIKDPEEDHDVELLFERVRRRTLLVFDLRSTDALRELESGRSLIRERALGIDVRGQDAGGAQALRLEAPEAIPGSDIEDTLASEVYAMHLALDGRPKMIRLAAGCHAAADELNACGTTSNCSSAQCRLDSSVPPSSRCPLKIRHLVPHSIFQETPGG
jgi:hypothetical protein